jgi:hypothetical protein
MEARAMLRAVQVPGWLYRWLPWICVAAGTLAMVLPAGFVAVCCTAYLYVYAAAVLARRGIEYWRYS